MKFFKQLTGKKPKGHLRSRLRSLAAYICGMIRNKSSHLSSLGKGLLQLIKGHSRMKAAKKFLYNKAIDYQTYYLPYMKELVKLLIPFLPSKNTIELAIDGSQIGKYHAILMVSLVYGKRSIPIGWLVKKGAKGHFSKANHVELVEQVQKDLVDVLPSERTIILLGDGEFGSVALQKCCRLKNWSYVFRIACNTILYKDEEVFRAKGLTVGKAEDYLILRELEPLPTDTLFNSIGRWSLPLELEGIPNQNHIFIEDVAITKEQFTGVHFVLWHDPKHDKPVPLISNLDNDALIIEAYDKRWAVECLFKDLKSTSFKLDKTRLKEAKAIDNLVMIAAFAFILVLNIGRLYNKHAIREYVHQVRPDQVVCSIFSLGLALVMLFLDYDIDFCFNQEVPFSIEQIKKRVKLSIEDIS